MGNRGTNMAKSNGRLATASQIGVIQEFYSGLIQVTTIVMGFGSKRHCGRSKADSDCEDTAFLDPRPNSVRIVVRVKFKRIS